MVVAASSSAVRPYDVRAASLSAAGLGAPFVCSCWVELSVFAGSAAGGLCGFLCSRVAEGAAGKLSWARPEPGAKPMLAMRRMEPQTLILLHYSLTRALRNACS